MTKDTSHCALQILCQKIEHGKATPYQDRWTLISAMRSAVNDYL